MKYLYYNGEIISKEKVCVSIADLGFLRGYGVFDALKTINGKPFLLEEHFDRLQKSSELLGINLQISKKEFVDILGFLLKKNKVNQDVYVKTIVTGGISPNGLKLNEKPTVLVMIGELQKVSLPPITYREGIKTSLLEYQRMFPEIKTLNYLGAIINQKNNERRGVKEVVYYYNGRLLEGGTSNVFLVKNEKVITSQNNILPGVTRNFLIEICRKNNYLLEEREVALDEVWTADEMFLTGTFKDILPVIEVDGKKISTGKVGKLTEKLMGLFVKEVKKLTHSEE